MERAASSAEWTNWGETVSCRPAGIMTPRTMEELAEIVKKAKAESRKIRVASTGYSWSPLVPTDDYLVRMSHFTGISLVAPDRIRVEAGATVDQVAAFCLANNVCFPDNVVTGMGDATYGGLMAPGNQGTGRNCLCISDSVVEMTVLASSGEARSFSLEKDGERMMRAVSLALGMFGIICSMTLKVEPMFNVHVVERMEQVSYVRDNLKALADGNDYLQIWWNPYNDKARVHKANRTGKPATRNGYADPNPNLFKQALFNQANMLGLNMIEAGGPVYVDGQALPNPASLTPAMVRTSLELANLYEYIANVIHFTYNQDYSYILDTYKIVDIEVVYELDDELESTRKAFDILERKTKKWSAKGKYPLNVDACFRFMQGSRCILSPAYGNARTGMVEIYAYYKTGEFPSFAGEVASAWMDALPKARPHWAKGFQFMENAPAIMKRAYGGQIAEFMELRGQSGVDPENMFVNGYLSEIFG